MKFQPANQKLPTKPGFYFCKTTVNGEMDRTTVHFEDGRWTRPNRIYDYRPYEIEWLDEVADSDAEEFLRDFITRLELQYQKNKWSSAFGDTLFVMWNQTECIRDIALRVFGGKFVYHGKKGREKEETWSEHPDDVQIIENVTIEK